MKRKNRNGFKDSLFAYLFVMTLLYIISLIPLEFEILNPLQSAIKDFRLTDVVFSHMRESPKVEDRVVLVNIGKLNRAGIAAQIKILNKYDPKVIGIDAFFRDAKDPEGDFELMDAFSEVENLVLVSELIEDEKEGKIKAIEKSHPMFMDFAYHGFADMITEGEDKFLTSRDFSPKENFDDDCIYSFPAKMIALYDSVPLKALFDRNNDTEIINYQGNIDQTRQASLNSKNIFTALDIDQVFDEAFEPEVIKGKIVIMGYMGEYIGYNKWGEDKFFTPLNKTYIGKTFPDMYGVVVHANIVSMILKGEYIDEMSDAFNFIFGLCIMYLNVLMCCFIFLKLKEMYDGVTVILALVQIALLLFLVLIVFDNFNYTINITVPCIAIFIIPNLIELYYGIIRIGIRKIQNKYVNLSKVKTVERYEN